MALTMSVRGAMSLNTKTTKNLVNGVSIKGMCWCLHIQDNPKVAQRMSERNIVRFRLQSFGIQVCVKTLCCYRRIIFSRMHKMKPCKDYTQNLPSNTQHR